MSDLKTMFERQAEWQQARAKLSWTEKLRLAAKLRDVALSMRRRPRESDRIAVEESRRRTDGN